MKYRITLEVDDPEGFMGDSPDPRDVAAWTTYLDLDGESSFMRVAKVEVVA